MPDADVFFLRKIIHDWPFSKAKQILQQLAKALKRGGLILVMDTILPAPASVPSRHEALLRQRDLLMTQNFNAKERELEEWVALFSSCEPKLRLTSWKAPVGSFMAVMVLTREDDHR